MPSGESSSNAANSGGVDGSGIDGSAYYDANQAYYSGYDYSTNGYAAMGADASGYNYDASQYYYDPSYYSQYYGSVDPNAAAASDPTPTASNPVGKYAPVSSYQPTSSYQPSAGTGANNASSSAFMLPVSTSGYTGPRPASSTPASVAEEARKKGKKKSLVRAAGGEVWEDPSLADWDDNDYRLFAGDLGNEVTEELLFKAFSKYSSLQRTRIVRDKRTGKSRGYGFISLKDPNEFVKAWREMNGKYVGNRPIKLRKSNWKDRNMDVRVKKERERVGPYQKNR